MSPRAAAGRVRERRAPGPSGERGQAVVEMALVVPILALLMFGLFDVGRIVHVSNTVAQGAREGSRWGTVAGRSASVSGRDGIVSWTLGRLPGVPAPVADVSCERAGAVVTACHAGDILVVRVRSRVTPITPVIGDLVGSIVVESTSRVAVQG